MKTVLLCNGERSFVDDEDYELAAKFRWYLTPKGYACSTISNTQKIWLHRIIAKTPVGFETDHINRNKLDNRKRNLRYATTAQNQANRVMRNKTTGYIGVSFDPRYARPYVARISFMNRNSYIGCFHNPLDAALAYDARALELRREFAVTNFSTK